MPLTMQDAAILLALLAPGLIAGVLAMRGLRPWPMARALLRRNRGINLLLAGLMALSVGLGTALTSQERALRIGSARAADPFDVIVAAPGDRISMLLAAVYLRPADAPLLGGEVLARMQADPRIALMAPIAFGDSWNGAPVVGSTAEFVRHLGAMQAGRVFAAEEEAVAGALSPLQVGDHFTPAHGGGADDEDQNAHDGHSFEITGKMAPTGSPWDRALIVPIEAVWAVHGLPEGHAPGTHTIGPPFDPAYFPGTPAFLVSAKTMWGNYALANDYGTDTTMAFFPGAELSRLHGLLGDVRRLMSLMAGLAQALVAAGALAGLAALARLFAPRFALMRALGAPRRFTLAVMWSYAAALIGAGAAGGLMLGWAASFIAARIVTAETEIAVSPGLGWPELHLVAAFFSTAAILALAPAVIAFRRPAVEDLRGR
ncbi:MAG: putative ABC transport system permease protein [Paracoccaceae bacterium]|jgi:putative ABC transport system permease protein